MAWDLPGLITLAIDRTATYFNKFKSCFDVLDQHTHDGADGGGAVLTDLYQDRMQVLINPLFCWDTGRFSSFNLSSGPLGTLQQGSGLVNDECTYKVRLDVGIYTVKIIYGKDTNCGIATFYVNDVSLGSVDGYDTGSSSQNIATLSLTVTEFQIHTFKLKVTGKNNASSSYIFEFQGALLYK